VTGTPSPRDVEGVRKSIMNLSDRVRELADDLPDERWFNLADYPELVEIRACLSIAADELQRALAHWG
jgi:hypothetical protein